jgi:hypothetical protein
MATITHISTRILIVFATLLLAITLQWSSPDIPIVSAQDDGTDPEDATATFFIRNPNFEEPAGLV